MLTTLLVSKKTISGETEIASEQKISPATTQPKSGTVEDDSAWEENKNDISVTEENRNPIRVDPIRVKHSPPTVRQANYIVATLALLLKVNFTICIHFT